MPLPLEEVEYPGNVSLTSSFVNGYTPFSFSKDEGGEEEEEEEEGGEEEEEGGERDEL